MARGANPIEAAERALGRASGQLLALPGVVGVGIGRRGNRVVIVVMTDSSDEQPVALPSAIEGFPVVTEQTGPIAATPASR